MGIHILIPIYVRSYTGIHICVSIYLLVNSFWVMYPLLWVCKHGLTVYLTSVLWQPVLRMCGRSLYTEIFHTNVFIYGYPYMITHICTHIYDSTYMVFNMFIYVCYDMRAHIWTYYDTYMFTHIYAHIYEHNFWDWSRNHPNPNPQSMYPNPQSMWVVLNNMVHIWTHIYELS